MSGLDGGDLRDALAYIGKDEALRRDIIQTLVDYENRKLPWSRNLREEVTGPIVDALYAGSDTVSRELANGIVITCPYRSKIAREFLMATADKPTFVWEPQTTKILLHFAEGAKNVLIGGAYFGDQAILIANVLKSSGGIAHCFDANPDQLAALVANAEANGLREQVKDVLAGLWHEEGKLLSLEDADSHAAATLTDDENGIKTRTIDNYCREAGIEKLDLIMLDIEGSELPALQGALGQMGGKSEPGPIIVFEVHRHYVDWDSGLHTTDIVKDLASRGYTSYAIRDYQGHVDMTDQPIELVTAETANLEGPPHGFNMLAIKDTSRLDHPLFRIRENVSPKLLFHRDPSLHQPIKD